MIDLPPSRQEPSVLRLPPFTRAGLTRKCRRCYLDHRASPRKGVRGRWYLETPAAAHLEPRRVGSSPHGPVWFPRAVLRSGAWEESTEGKTCLRELPHTKQNLNRKTDANQKGSMFTYRGRKTAKEMKHVDTWSGHIQKWNKLKIDTGLNVSGGIISHASGKPNANQNFA